MSIKLKFRASTDANKEGTLLFQVIHERVVRQIMTGYYIYANEWNDKYKKYGYINTKGEIVIKPQYEEANGFAHNRAVVREFGKKDYTVIDEKGKKVFSINSDKMHYGSYDFTNGSLSKKTSKDDNYRVEILDRNGELVLRTKEYYSFVFPLEDGYIFVMNYNGDKDAKGTGQAILNSKGETVFRMGKYEDITYAGNNQFIVKRGDKYGAVDKDDNVLCEYNYDGFLYNRMLFRIAKIGKTGILLDKNWKEIKNSEIFNLGGKHLSKVTYYDFEGLVKTVTKEISKAAYENFKGGETVEQVAKIKGINTESNLIDRDIIKGKSGTYGETNYQVLYTFSSKVLVEKGHIEKVSDGWFTYDKVVSDGIGWNSDAFLDGVIIRVYIENHLDELKKAIANAVKTKGFKPYEDGYSLEAKDNNKINLVTICNLFDDEKPGIEIRFLPNREYSLDDVDND